VIQSVLSENRKKMKSAILTSRHGQWKVNLKNLIAKVVPNVPSPNGVIRSVLSENRKRNLKSAKSANLRSQHRKWKRPRLPSRRLTHSERAFAKLTGLIGCGTLHKHGTAASFQLAQLLPADSVPTNLHEVSDCSQKLESDCSFHGSVDQYNLRARGPSE
jgi:hypothetical protein